MIKIAICDDEMIAASQIEMLIFDISRIKGIPVDVDVFYNSRTLIKEIAGGMKYDLLYLGFQTKNERGLGQLKVYGK